MSTPFSTGTSALFGQIFNSGVGLVQLLQYSLPPSVLGGAQQLGQGILNLGSTLGGLI